MTKEQFEEIKESLRVWREERHLTYENQQKGFLGNVFKEVSEYFRAKDDLEKVDALCDIAVFYINSFNFEYETITLYENLSKELFTRNLIYRLGDFIEKNKELDLEFIEIEFGFVFLALIENMVSDLGFDFYKCMQETIKEISSRTGKYDESIGKFIKDEGYYSIEDLKLNLKLPKTYEIIDVIDKKDLFLVKIKTPNTILNNKFKKWYKADYESCRLLK